MTSEDYEPVRPNMTGITDENTAYREAPHSRGPLGVSDDDSDGHDAASFL